MKIVNFYEVSANFALKPAEAIAFFGRKGLKPTFAWQDMLGEEHDAAFTVAKMMDTDLLHTVKAKLDGVLDSGGTLQEFKKQMIPLLQKAGWWGKKDLIDPLTGTITKAQLGSASRLETIFRTNLQSAYSVGHWQAIQSQASEAPFLLYDAVDDHRTRPEHAALDGTVLPVKHAFWHQYMPPNGWNCRCGVIQLDHGDLNAHGLQATDKAPWATEHAWKNPRTGVTSFVPDNLDPGWDHNPGKARYDTLQQLAADKAALATKAEQAALKKAEKASQAALAAEKKKIAQDATLKAAQQADAEKATQAATEAAAQDTIDQALADKTPYLAQAIKQITKPSSAKGMSATDILAAAQDKAILIEQSAHLSGYKANSIKGKKPSAKQKAAFDALPDEAQTSMLADIDSKTGAAAKAAEAAAADAAALTELETIAAGNASKQAGLKKKILAKIEADPVQVAQFETPSALLNEVVEQAAKQQANAEKASTLSGYKKKILAGKLPTEKQAKVFEGLSDAEKTAFLQKIDAEKAKLAADAAEIDELLTPPPGVKPTGVPATGLGYDDLTPEQKYESLYSGMGLDWEHPWTTPAQFKKMAPAEKTLALQELEEAVDLVDSTLEDVSAGYLAKLNKTAKPAKAPKAPKPAPEPEPIGPVSGPSDGPPSMDDLTQIGGQGGSNKGGLYQDTGTGIKWYVKEPRSADIAKNEVLTGKLYQAAGVEVPELYIAKEGSTTRIFSKIIDGLETDAAGLKAGKVAGVNDNFVVDAWLGNWDVVGLGYDNLMVKGGRAIRIDTGAGLRYRAQGATKGSNWNNRVGEIDSLRDASTNSQSAAVFGNASEADLLAGARKVLAIDKAEIEQLVSVYGPATKAEKTKLVNTLLARQQAIAARFPEARAKPKAAPKVAKGGERVNDVELLDIEDSRVNGVTLPTDKGDIEDQNVLLWHKTDTHGEAVTGGYLKARGKAETALKKTLKNTDTPPDHNELHPILVNALKSLHSRIDTNGSWTSEALTKLKVAIIRYDEVLDTMKLEVKNKQRPAAQLKAFEDHTGPYVANLRAALDQPVAKAGEVPMRRGLNLDLPLYKGKPIAPPTAPNAKGKDGEILWTKRKNDYTLAQLRNAHAREQGDRHSVTGFHYEATVNGAKVKYWPTDGDTLFALRGRIEIEVPGKDKASAARIFDAIEDLGIDNSRATEFDIEDLYLRKIAYMHKLDKDYDKRTKAMDIDQKRSWIEQQTNAGRPLLNNPHYQPDGERQAFSHGRRVQYHPEILDDPKWAEFDKEYRLHHSVTNGDVVSVIEAVLNGGGQMAPSTDKMRRGIPLGGMSPTRDLETGGASYFFTRIKRKDSALRKNGIVWRVKPAARMDAISYIGDKYGKVTSRDYVQSNRHVGVDAMKQASQGGSNETIFKDSLSLFDDMDRIKTGSIEKQKKLVAIFKKHGYDTWPDGRSLNSVIVP